MREITKAEELAGDALASTVKRLVINQADEEYFFHLNIWLEDGTHLAGKVEQVLFEDYLDPAFLRQQWDKEKNR